jgi:membrane fusion protein (multidrug efflux system)
VAGFVASSAKTSSAKTFWLGIFKHLVCAALVAGAGLGGWYWWTAARFIETTDNAYVEADISAISPQVSGYIRDLPVESNQPVRKGDVLAVLEDEEYAAKVQEASAAVDLATAAVATAAARIAQAVASVDAASAAVASAEAERTRTRRDLERSAVLVSREGVSRRQYDEREADAHKGDAAYNGAVAALAADRKRILTLEAEMREASARVQQAEVRLRLARIDQERTVVRSPVDGVVGNRGAQIGQFVRAGTLMMAVVPLDTVHIVANFKETQLSRMKIGQRVRITVDAYADRDLFGRIESLAPASGSRFSVLPPDNATGNFTKIVQRVPVRIALEPENRQAGILRPGLSVEASIDTREAAGGTAPAFGALAAPVNGKAAP